MAQEYMSPRVSGLVQRLSLREPQARSLEILDEVCSLGSWDIESVRGAFPSVTDFDRGFPSLCFALATGVGKTRLMGAFIAYLFQMKRSRHFLVLAPNLTIYRKLIEDFRPGSEKYVFQGIAEFAATPPVVITGESYDRVRLVEEQRGQAAFWDTTEAHINIFNIAKLGTKEGRKVSRLQETLGESYFGYLSELPDLVLLMDESHRYRAKAALKTINELKPVLGLELTATPRVETGGGREFQNVIYRFDLADALDHGFVKVPAVGTRENFLAAGRSDKEIETVKLQDGIRMHEETKVQLETYALQAGVLRVKPFVLVIARDTVHAEDLRREMESAEFFGGAYAGKVITVHSNQSGEEADDTVEKLLTVESAENETEIVVHVNMLKEGWDVRNLYTVVPLRAGSSRTLVEQSIGRGLRLPYGKRTGVEAVDRLTIVAHDRFQEIVDFARGKESPFRKPLEVRYAPVAKMKAETVPPEVELRVLQAAGSVAERSAARETLRVIRDFENLLSSAELQRPETQARICELVGRTLAAQGELPLGREALAGVAARTTALYEDLTISIPSIVVTPIDDESGYRDFNLDLRGFRQQPSDDAILIQDLHGEGRRVLARALGKREEEPEHVLVQDLANFNEISYEINSVLLFKLAGQAIAHLRSYLPDELSVKTVLEQNKAQLVALIHAQMQTHFEEKAAGYLVTLGKKPRKLDAEHFPVQEGQAVLDYRDPVQDKQGMRQVLFGGFQKCLYGRQRFDTDGERKLAVVLENDGEVLKWYKPARNDFQIYYGDESAYEPDFVVETDKGKFLCEPKRGGDLDDRKVMAKAKAARTWCERASTVSAKPWRYLLIPHEQIAENRTFGYFALNCM